jgi:hypothetical protein
MAGQSTIAYSGFVARGLDGLELDVDGDGVAELSFGRTYTATSGNPSFHTNAYSVTPAGHASVLFQDDSIHCLPAGAPVGSSSPGWSTEAKGWPVVAWSWMVPTPLPDSSLPGTGHPPEWFSGPLADTGGTAFLGLRFQTADGPRYGWVRLAARQLSHPDNPFRIHLGPSAVDWAFDTRPGVGILAGARPVLVSMNSPEVVRPGHLRLEWPAAPGGTYQVQSKDRLDAFAWTNLGFSLPASGTNLMVDLPIEKTVRFFRVVEAD